MVHKDLGFHSALRCGWCGYQTAFKKRLEKNYRKKLSTVTSSSLLLWLTAGWSECQSPLHLQQSYCSGLPWQHAAIPRVHGAPCRIPSSTWKNYNKTGIRRLVWPVERQGVCKTVRIREVNHLVFGFCHFFLCGYYINILENMTQESLKNNCQFNYVYQTMSP